MTTGLVAQIVKRRIKQWLIAQNKKRGLKRMTPEEFLADPKAQDAVYQHKMVGEYIPKYGADAGKAWFAAAASPTVPRSPHTCQTQAGRVQAPDGWARREGAM
jgi:hypothetical protein